MAENLDRQITQYKQRLDTFLSNIKDGTFDEDIDYIRANYQNLNEVQRKKIDEQISSWIPETERPPVVENESTKRQKQSILKSITSTIAGALGLPPNLREAGRRFVSNARNQLKQNLPNPGVLINNILNPPRYRTQDKIKPENFYSANKEIVTTDINKYKEQDNGRSHLIMFHVTNTDPEDVLIFRMANFTGLTDTFSVTNSSQRYFGRPENFYQYQSVERSISFNFDVVIQSEEDVNVIYGKLNTLSSLTYPHKYTDTKMFQPNILRLTIGDYIFRRPFFVDSITYTSADDVVYYDNKPGQISVSVQGKLVQPEQYSEYESKELYRYIAIPSQGQGIAPTLNELSTSRIRRVRG